jgi:hypothetical protein
MATKLMPGWTAVYGDFDESKAQIARGKLESFGVPTALLDPSQAGLGARPIAYRFTVAPIVICLLMIPVGAFVMYRLIDGMNLF